MFPGVDMNVEYIMTNGQQFILTDWIPLTDTKIEMYFHVKDAVIKGNLKNNGAMDYEYNNLYLWNSKPFQMGGIIKKVNLRGYYISTTPQLFCMSKDSVEYYYFPEHATSGSMTKMSLQLRTQPCTTPLSLFTNCYNRAKLYIYGIKCWNNGILERGFVPAKRNGIYGLYDKVNKKFWRSSSGVDFLGKDK